MSLFCPDAGDRGDCDCGLPEHYEHLSPSYKPDWGDGQIHLNGEMDFPGDRALEDVFESLKERAPEVGALVRGKGSRVLVTPSMSPATYELIPEDRDPANPVETINVHLEKTHQADEAIEHVDVERMVNICTDMKELLDEADPTFEIKNA